VCKYFRQAMGIIETFDAVHNQDQEEKQALRDEINRLKGEQGKPTIRPNTEPSRDISSEKERKVEPPEKKKGRRARNHKIRITKPPRICKCDPEKLPPDAIFKGFHDVIVQNLKIVLDNEKLLLEVYYSPSMKKTFMADRPQGCVGEYEVGVHELIFILKHIGNMSESCIHTILTSYGLLISKSTVSRLVRKVAARLEEEAAAILRAGIQSGKYVNFDDTGARVNGKQHYTQILCNPFFTAYVTMDKKDRLTLLRMLLMGTELQFRFNDATFEMMELFKVPEKVRAFLKEQCMGKTLTEQELERILKDIPSDNRNPSQLHRRIKESAGITWYHEQTEVPVIRTIISDDAPQFRHLALDWHGLCWVHAGRLIKKLIPRSVLFQEELDRVLEEFWDYYDTLKAFREDPENYDIEELRARFDKIFTQTTDYPALDKILQSLFDNKEHLLVVLHFPEAPLNNNPAELGARVQVRKRDVSLHTMTAEGTTAVDTSMTILQTAKKLGVNAIELIHDRLTKNELESLAVTLLKKVGLPT